MGDTRYVHWAEGDSGGTVNQVTVLGDRDEELRPQEWWVVSQGSEGGQIRRGGEGEGEEERGGGGIFRVPGDLLFLIREEVGAYFHEALEERDGDDGYDKGGGGTDKGEGGDKGGDKRGEEGARERGDKGVRRKGARGVRRGVPGARMCPGSPPPHGRGSLRVVTRERGAGGLGG